MSAIVDFKKRKQRRRERREEPPHNFKAERAVLGAMMVDQAAAREALAELEPGDFYREAHTNLFELMGEMHEDGKPISSDSVITTIETEEFDADEYGGYSYISAIADKIPSSENVGYYCRVVADLRVRRDVLHALDSLTEGTRSGGMTLPEVSEGLAKLVGESSGRSSSGVATIGELSRSFWARVEQEAAGERRAYLPTGMAVLDNDARFGGWSPEGMTIVIGASGMGKTSLLNRAALGMVDQGYHVGLYGTETPSRRRWNDLVSSVAGINMRKWNSMSSQRATAYERLSPSQRAKQHVLPHEQAMRAMLDAKYQAAERVDPLPLHIIDTGLTVDEFAVKVRQLHRRGLLQAVIADYLQGFVASRRVKGNKIDQVGHTSKVLADLSAELEIPIIVGAQRSGEKQIHLSEQSKDFEILRPTKSDVQYSSAAHQDAEEVYSLYRYDYYAEDYPHLAHKLPGRPGVIELIARKRRNGSKPTWHLPFHGPSKWVGDRNGWGIR